MSSKPAVKEDKCTPAKKEECKNKGKICNPNSKSNVPDVYCFNDTEKNRQKIKDFEKKFTSIII